MKKTKKLLTVLMVMTILFSMFSVSTASAANYINTFTVQVVKEPNAYNNLNNNCTVKMATSNAYSIGLTIYLEKEDPSRPNLFTAIKSQSYTGLPTSFNKSFLFSGSFDKGTYRYNVVAFIHDKSGNLLQSQGNKTDTFKLQ